MDKGKGEIMMLSDYAISKVGSDSIKSLIQGNLGGSQLQISDLPKVKIPAGGSTTWLVPPDDSPVKDLEGIVIYQHDIRALFAQSENGAISNEPPLCTSDDALTGTAGKGQPVVDCGSCPSAAWGSAGAGKKGQACKMMHRIYLLSQGSILPVVLTLSPSSISVWRKYMISLINTRKTAGGVVTKVSLEKVTGGPAPYARILPSFVRALTDEEAKFVEAYASGIIPVLRAAPYAQDDDEQLEAVA